MEEKNPPCFFAQPSLQNKLNPRPHTHSDFLDIKWHLPARKSKFQTDLIRE